MFRFKKMFKFEDPQRLPYCYWLTIPALFSLLYMSIVYEFHIYELLFWLDVRDVEPQYPGISAQYGVKRALRHIDEFFSWYRYSAIVFIVSYYLNPVFCVDHRGIIGFLKLYIKVFFVYFLSVFISLIIFVIMEIKFDGVRDFLIIVPGAIYYTFIVFSGFGDDVYAPYALPAVFASVFVTAGIFIYRPNKKNQADAKNARLI